MEVKKCDDTRSRFQQSRERQMRKGMSDLGRLERNQSAWGTVHCHGRSGTGGGTEVSKSKDVHGSGLRESTREVGLRRI